MTIAFQNLDVNLAVNNLLSLDDDEGDDADDASDPYMSDDLMSLLDAGIAHAGTSLNSFLCFFLHKEYLQMEIFLS